MPGILSLTSICCLIILLMSAALSAEITDGELQIIQGDVVPIYDAVQYQTQACVEREGVSEGMELYLKRPYGYIRSTSDTTANLSIVRTNIERYSKTKAVIKGEIKNLDDTVIDLVVVTFNLYNADGDQIGNAYASIDYLSPRTTWKFTTDIIERSDFQFERYGSIYIGVYGN